MVACLTHLWLSLDFQDETIHVLLQSGGGTLAANCMGACPQPNPSLKPPLNVAVTTTTVYKAFTDVVLVSNFVTDEIHSQNTITSRFRLVSQTKPVPSTILSVMETIAYTQLEVNVCHCSDTATDINRACTYSRKCVTRTESHCCYSLERDSSVVCNIWFTINSDAVC